MTMRFWHFVAWHFGCEFRLGKYKLMIFDGMACITRRERWRPDFFANVIIWQTKFRQCAQTPGDNT